MHFLRDFAIPLGLRRALSPVRPLMHQVKWLPYKEIINLLSMVWILLSPNVFL